MWSPREDASDHRLLWQLREALSSCLEERYLKPVVLFEHGAPDASDSRPCSVSHAHWHLVPSEAGLEAILLPEYQWERIDSPLTNSDAEYLMVSDGRKNHWVSRANGPIPSQILRRRLASVTGGPASPWDWRAELSLSRMIQTLDDLRGRFATCAS